MHNIHKYDKNKYNLILALVATPKKPIGDSGLTVINEDSSKWVCPAILFTENSVDGVKTEVNKIIDDLFSKFEEYHGKKGS